MNNLITRNGLIPRREDLFFPIEEQFNKIFDSLFDGPSLNGIKSKTGFPRIDVHSEQNNWQIDVALPGVNPKDIEVEIVPMSNFRTLKISGKMESTEENKTYHVKELRRSQFERTITLPDYVKGDPEAVMKNGLLSLGWKIEKEKPPEKKLLKIKVEE